MIRAYDKKYLNDAMLNPGVAFDFAANVCQVELDNFLSMMISTGIAFLFERGVPKYVSGMSGTELALEILQKSGVPVENPAARTEYSCSPNTGPAGSRPVSNGTPDGRSRTSGSRFPCGKSSGFTRSLTKSPKIVPLIL